jgi:hypothetical protein
MAFRVMEFRHSFASASEFFAFVEVACTNVAGHTSKEASSASNHASTIGFAYQKSDSLEPKVNR